MKKNNIKGKQELSFTKLSQIAEILGLLDETGRGKQWLVDQLKKLKISTKTSINSFEILKECPDDFVSQMLRSLKGEDIAGFEEIKTLTKTYHWFFTDIVAGSNPLIPTKNQVKKIIVLNELILRNEKLLIRVGIDMGPVYVIKDINDMDNVWGPGIILTRRVMDLAGDMNIFASARIAEDTRKLSSEYKEIMHPIGDYHIKHGEELQLYNIYGNGFGNKIAPRSKKVEKLTADKMVKPSYNFAFRTIDILLDVIEPTTLLTHHTWVWKLENISKEAKIKTRVLRVDSETGYRVYASPNPVVKYLDDKTVVSWSKNNLKAF